MALPPVWSAVRVAILSLSVVGLLSVGLVGAAQDSGSVIPAESRPCVDCHAFEFMQRALQDLKKTAYNLDTRLHDHKAKCDERNQLTASSPSSFRSLPSAFEQGHL